MGKKKYGGNDEDRRDESYSDPSKIDNKKWQEAYAIHKDFYDKLTLGGCNDERNAAFQQISNGESNAIKAAILFIECRPFYFRSGYAFQIILHKLKQANRKSMLSPEQQKRYESVLELLKAQKESKLDDED